MLWQLGCVAITLPAVHLAALGLQVACNISFAEHLAGLLKVFAYIRNKCLQRFRAIKYCL